MILDTHFQTGEGEDTGKKVRTVRFGDSHLYGVANGMFYDADGNASMAIGFSIEPVTILEDAEIMLQFLTVESLDIFIGHLQALKEGHKEGVKK